MRHLEQERLAALDHDAATLEELAHLAACVACRAEREAFTALAAMAADAGRAPSDPDAPRLVSWDRLSAGLRREGLIPGTADPAPAEVHVRPQVVRTPEEGERPVRTIAGRASRGFASRGFASRGFASRGFASRGFASRGFAATRAFRIAATIAAMAGAATIGRLSARPGLMSPTGGAADRAAAASNASVAQALRSTAFGGGEAFASVGEATATLMRAQQEYERASLWLAGNDTTTRSSDVYRARLAALDQMMAASRAALRDAPQDPVLNHYFLAAYNAREATLQQLSGALPVDKTIESY